MAPEGPGGTTTTGSSDLPPDPAAVAGPSWQPGIPTLREHLPSLVFGGAVPLGIYFLVRSHLQSDAQALIVAGCFSAGWILLQFARQRAIDAVGAAVLLGFALGVITSTLLGGNAYLLKVRDGFFTLLIGVACIVTLYTHDRPVFFYVNRYLSAGRDPSKVSVFDRLHEQPLGRHTFRTLSLVWGIGLVVEASTRLTLADVLPTATFLVVSPFVTAVGIGGLFAFTVAYTNHNQVWSAGGALVEHDRATVSDVGSPGVDAASSDEDGEAAPPHVPR
jgi:hypothetical protein